jgi:hypothetical protein
MRNQKSIATAVWVKIRARKRGKVFTPMDFLRIGPRSAVDQSLHRLFLEKKLARVGRGLYYRPFVAPGQQGQMPPLDAITATLARREGSLIMPSGAHCAHLFGLTDTAPTGAVYLTNGRSRTIVIGGIEVKLKHIEPRCIRPTSKKGAMLIQALKWLGKKNLSPDKVARLRSKLSAKERKRIKMDIRWAPGWMRPALLTISATTRPSPKTITPEQNSDGTIPVAV